MADDIPEHDIEARLAAAAAARREGQLLLAQRRELEQRASQAQGEVDAWRSRVAIDRRDVERLEGLSPTRILASLLGSREDKLAREQAELDAGALRLQDAEARLAAVHREHAHVDQRLAGLARAEEDYAAVLDEKEAYLRRAGDDRASRLLALAEERGRHESERVEVQEALVAIANANVALREVEVQLGSAGSWSTWDVLGGGMISSMMKQARMDDAAAAARAADAHLLTLRHELADLAHTDRTAPALEMTDLTRFFDVWFDNIFTDFQVANRIDRARGNLRLCRSRVDDLQRDLVDAKARLDVRLTEIAAVRRATLTADSR